MWGLLILMDRSVDSSWKYFLTYILLCVSVDLLISSKLKYIKPTIFTKYMYVPFNIVTYYSETNGRTKLLMFADRNGFSSGWRGVGFTFWNGGQSKKKRNTVKIYSASLPIQSLLQTLVCPSCGNGLSLC